MYRGSWWYECGANVRVFINTSQRKRFFLFVSSGISAQGKARLNRQSRKFRYFVPSEYGSPWLTYVIGTESINQETAKCKLSPASHAARKKLLRILETKTSLPCKQQPTI